MIVGCYSLDLYCDLQVFDGDLSDHGYEQFPWTYTAEMGSSCRKQARKDGWRLDLKAGRAYCPTCVKAGKAPSKG